MVDTEVVISLDDDRAKYISEVLGNKSCKKILGFLSENESTVSDISKALKIPINTTDYNIKKMIKAGLIEKANFWWSVKGKKMPTYRVSNKKIIISPKSFKSYSKYLFALALSGAAALVIRSMNLGKRMIEVPVETFIESGQFARDSSQAIVSTAQNVAEQSAGLAAKKSADMVLEGGNIAVNAYTTGNIWLWFLIGAWSMVFVFFAFNLFIEGKFFKLSKEKTIKKLRENSTEEYILFDKSKGKINDSKKNNIKRDNLKGGSKKNEK